MTNRKSWIVIYKEDVPKEVTVANNEKFIGFKRGDVKIKIPNSITTSIPNVVFVPNSSVNLLSVSKMVEKYLCVTFTKAGCKIVYTDSFKCTGKIIATAACVNGIYKIDVIAKENETARRLGLLNTLSIHAFRQGMGTSIKDNLSCISCIKCKQIRLPLPKRGGKRASQKLELVHSNLCGYFWKLKLFDIQSIKALEENESGFKIKYLVLDLDLNGVEHYLPLYTATFSDLL